MGIRFLISELFLVIVVAAILALLAVLCLLFIMRVLLRNQKLAIVACMLIYALPNSPENAWSLAIAVALSPIFFYVLTRFGLLAPSSTLFAVAIATFPMTLDASAWYSDYGLFVLLIFATIVLYAFYHSLGGRPLFGTPRIDD